MIYKTFNINIICSQYLAYIKKKSMYNICDAAYARYTLEHNLSINIQS